MTQANGAKTTIEPKWIGQADGPYIHVDDIIRYLSDTIAGITNEALGDYVGRMEHQFVKWKANSTAVRLKNLATPVDPATLAADLIELRQELE